MLGLLLLFAVVSGAVGIAMLAGTAWTYIFLSVIAFVFAVVLARGMSGG